MTSFSTRDVLGMADFVVEKVPRHAIALEAGSVPFWRIPSGWDTTQVARTWDLGQKFLAQLPCRAGIADMRGGWHTQLAELHARLFLN